MIWVIFGLLAVLAWAFWPRKSDRLYSGGGPPTDVSYVFIPDGGDSNCGDGGCDGGDGGGGGD